MEGSIKHLLNNLCETMMLKSWTVHTNPRSTVCTLRFFETGAILEYDNPTTSIRNSQNTAAYKRKSRYQMNRDHSRIETHKKRSTETSTENNTEIARSGESFSIQHSIPDSPEVVQTNSMNFHCMSPIISMDEVQSTGTMNTEETIEQKPSHSENNIELYATPEQLGSEEIPSSESDVYVESPPETIDVPLSPVAPSCVDCVAELDVFSDISRKSSEADIDIDPPCSVCEAVAPFHTKMQTCSECDYSICGACVLSSSAHLPTCKKVMKPPTQTTPPKELKLDAKPTKTKPPDRKKYTPTQLDTTVEYLLAMENKQCLAKYIVKYE